jgi:uncharacterized protein
METIMAKRSLALVTGASSGIGRELARSIAAAGYDLVLAGRREVALAEAAAELAAPNAGTIRTVAADLSTAEGVATVWAATGGQPLAILVNNAGFNVAGPFAATELADQMALIDTHIGATVRLTRLALPGMIAAGTGRILNLGSIASYAPAPGDAVYAAAKAFILRFGEGLAAELAGTGVTVTTLCPGATRTAFATRSGIERTWLFSVGTMDAPSVARAGFAGMMAGRRVVMPGFSNRLLVASAGLMPRALRDWTARIMLTEAPSWLIGRMDSASR